MAGQKVLNGSELQQLLHWFRAWWDVETWYLSHKDVKVIGKQEVGGMIAAQGGWVAALFMVYEIMREKVKKE